MGRILGLLLVVIVAVGIGYAYMTQSQSTTPPAGADAAAAQALAGPLAPYKGNVVLVDFWATWCGPCKLAMPGMQRIHEKYQGKPVVVVGANVWERGDPVAYMASNHYTYELLRGADDMAQSFDVEGIPTFVLIAPNGEVLYKAVGYNPDHEKELTAKIDEALASM